MTEPISATQHLGERPARSSDDRGYGRRKRGVYVLAGVCVAFFVVVISANGEPASTIASALGVSRATVYRVLANRDD